MSDIQTRANTDLATVEAIKAQLAAQAEYSQGLHSGGNFISFARGNMKVNGQPVPNNTAEVRVLAVVPERAWYDQPYDPDSPQVPACFSIGNTGKPHPNSRAPQSDACATCKYNQWGSAPPRPGSTRPGRGKACREAARIIVVPANMDFMKAPLYQAKLPVTSMKAADAFVTKCNQLGKLYGEFVVTMQVGEDRKSFFKVTLDVKQYLEDQNLSEIIARQNQALELALEPYPVFEDEE